MAEVDGFKLISFQVQLQQISVLRQVHALEALLREIELCLRARFDGGRPDEFVCYLFFIQRLLFFIGY